MAATYRISQWCLAFIVMGIFSGQSLVSAAERKSDPKFQSMIYTLARQQMNGQKEAAEKTMLDIERYVEGPLKQDPAYKAIYLGYKAAFYAQQGRYADAEILFLQAFDLAEKHLPVDDYNWALGMSHFAMLYKLQGLNPETQPRYQEVKRRHQRLLGDNDSETAEIVAKYNWEAAIMFSQFGMYAEAEPLLLETLRIQQQRKMTYYVQSTLVRLGNLYTAQGRYAEAESRFLQVLATFNEQTASNTDYGKIETINGLAKLYTAQGRYAEADALLQKTLIELKSANREQSSDAVANYGKFLAMSVLTSLADLYAAQERYDKAESIYRKAMTMREAYFKAIIQENDNLMVSSFPDDIARINNLANVIRQQGRHAEAESLYRRAIKAEGTLGAYCGDLYPERVMALNSLAALYCDQERYDEAMPLIERAINSSDQAGVAAGEREGSYAVRGDIHWAQKHPEKALADLRAAMNLAEEYRTQVSGAELQRAAAFAGHLGVFEKMVRWQAELGNAAEAYEALERSRARGLLDQIRTHGLDLLAGVPEDQVQALRQKESQAQVHLAELHKQLQALGQREDLFDEQKTQESERLVDEIGQARLECVKSYAAIRIVSPTYRLAVGKELKPVPLENLQAWVAEQNALLLDYLTGNEGGYVLIVPAAGKPRLEKLALDEKQAKALGVDAGPLTGARLSEVFSTEQGTGVLDRLRKADSKETVGEVALALAVLWEVMIPETERGAILGGKYKRLIVLPDGPMARLPFETLVVEKSDNRKEPQYLLDVAPPIEYAPSATILMNLVERREQSRVDGLEPVLTVGNPYYGPAEADESPTLLAELRAGARYGRAGGKLEPLFYSRWETAWVKEVFGESGRSSTQLQGREATEANVRRQMPGRRVVHLACHGLIDESYGNLFGALALTPGPSGDDAENDGFLTLAEIYGLNLKGCDLAILSACDTNVGPTQRGEGVWALSRGFLVAGARRVVASNWLVDDESTAGLMSYYCSILAKAEQEGRKPDHAEALRKAKRWLRSHENEKWHNPYYWATFVLIGPN